MNIKNCPKCNCEAKIQSHEAYSLDSSFEYVGCTECGIMLIIFGSEEDAIKEWNDREKKP